jgi:hypothetical protein
MNRTEADNYFSDVEVHHGVFSSAHTGNVVTRYKDACILSRAAAGINKEIHTEG